MNPKETPVTIGIEVEAQFKGSYDEMLHGDTTPPKGWENGYDVELEFRFNGPAKTIKDTFDRLDALGEYLQHHKLNWFNGCGTHIHLGVPAWTTEVYKRDVGAQEIMLNMIHGYLCTRHEALWPLIPTWRRTSSWCNPIRPPRAGTPLYQLHSDFWNGIGADGYDAVANRRNGIDTLEVRMFAGTDKTDTIKGYVALLINMLRCAEKRLSVLNLELLPEPRSDRFLPTTDIIEDPRTYRLDNLKEEIEEGDVFVEPLLDWIGRQRKSRTRTAAFEADLSEIYGSAYQASTPLAAAA